MTQTINDNLVLISGTSATGKSASLRNMRDQEGVIYLNCESGKKLPFPNKFQKFDITDPYQVYEAFTALEEGKLAGHTVVIDTLTFLLDMFESQYIVGSANGMAAWGQFQQYFKNLMQVHVAKAQVNVVFMAHTLATLNETEMAMEVQVPVKGALKNNGIESYFSVVVSTKKVPLKKLEGYASNMLNISEDDEMLGYKHVFQTRLTKDTINERIRSPMALFKKEETYIDNDVQVLLDHLHNYYNG